MLTRLTWAALQIRDGTCFQQPPSRVEAASHAANLISDTESAVNYIPLLIAQYKLIRYSEISLVFPKALVRAGLKEPGSLLMRAITIFCFYVLPYHLLTQTLTVPAQAKERTGPSNCL